MKYSIWVLLDDRVFLKHHNKADIDNFRQFETQVSDQYVLV